MTTIDISGTDLIVSVAGWDKLWALRSQLTIPLAHVVGASADPETTSGRRGFRALGTHIPGVITAGTFRQDGDWVFWNVHDPAKAIVIELADERYAKLVVEVEEPEAAVEVITSAIAGSGS